MTSTQRTQRMQMVVGRRRISGNDGFNATQQTSQAINMNIRRGIQRYQDNNIPSLEQEDPVQNSLNSNNLKRRSQFNDNAQFAAKNSYETALPQSANNLVFQQINKFNKPSPAWI